MKKQCNICGFREDVSELVFRNKTWCLVFGKEVDNKPSGCEHWHPDGSSNSELLTSYVKKAYYQWFLQIFTVKWNAT